MKQATLRLDLLIAYSFTLVAAKGSNGKSPFVKGDLEGFGIWSAQRDVDATLNLKPPTGVDPVW
jgi:hypothetical protein